MSFLKHIDKKHLHIARNMMLVGVFIFVGKLAGAFKEAAIAYRFGVSDAVDQFVFANTWVWLIPTIWSTIAITAFVPLARRMEERECEHFSAQVFSAVCIAAVSLTALVYFGLPLLIDSLPVGFNTSSHPEILVWIHGLSPMCGTGLMIGFLSARLLVFERHANTLAEGIPALAITAVVIGWTTGEITHSLIFGTLLGQVLHLIFLAVLLNNKGQFVTPGIIVNSPHWTIFRRAVGLLIIGKIITSFVGPIDQAIAADLGTGGIATLNYANKLISVFIGLGATAVARSILPVFSDRDAKVSEVTKLAKQWSLALILMGVVAVVCAYFLSHFLVEVVFQRGAFTAENTKEVAHVFNHGLLQLPFFFASIVLVQLFASRHLYWVLFVTSVLTIIVKSTASVVLSKSLGVAGIALGTGIMYFVNLMFLLYAMRYIEPNERLDHD